MLGIIVATTLIALVLNLILKNVHLPTIIGYILTGTIIAYTFTGLGPSGAMVLIIHVCQFVVQHLMSLTEP